MSKLIEKREKKISKAGNTMALYLSSKAKMYLKEGDFVDYEVFLEDDLMKIVATKKLYNFTLEDIRNLAKESGFTIEYDKTLDNVHVFNAIKNHLSLSYTKNFNEKTSPANIALSLKLPEVDYSTYKKITEQSVQFQKKCNMITRTEGDLDVINTLKEPKRYNVDMEEAFKLLRKAGKKIGISIVIRFDDMKNDLGSIHDTLSELGTRFPIYF